MMARWGATARAGDDPVRHLVDRRIRVASGSARLRVYAACGARLRFFPDLDRWDSGHPRACRRCVSALAGGEAA